MSIQVRSNESAASNTPPPQVIAAPENETVDSKKASISAQDSATESLQKNAEDSETLVADGNEETEVTSEAAGDDHESENDSSKTDDADKNKSQKKGGFQRRIDKLNAKISDKDKELEYWRSQAMKSQTEPKLEQKTEQKTESKTSANDGKPDPEKFSTHADYVEALTDWKTERKFMERDQKLEKSKLQIEQDKLARAYQERVKTFSEKNKDFSEVLSELNGVFVSPAVREIIFTSDNGPAIAYELAKNRDEFERVNKLSPLAAAKELGRIEARFSSNPSPEKNEPKKITNAPKPIDPVGAGGKGSVKKSIYDSNLSQAEYESLRREENKRRRAN